MSSQSHGIVFQNKVASTFPGATDIEPDHHAIVDIPKKYDIEGLNTHVKTDDGGSSYEMADARAFMKNTEKFRLVVGIWTQQYDKKVFHTINEYIILEDHLLLIKGDLSYDEVKQFHDDIHAFPYGTHVAARVFAKQAKVLLNKKSKYLTLHPKIGSDIQHRITMLT